MATAVRVEAAVPGRRNFGNGGAPVDLDLPLGPVTLRRLIESVLRAEVEAFRTGAELPSFVSVLTQESLATGPEAGVVRSGGSDTATDVVAELLDPEWKRLLPLRRVYAVDRAAGGA